MKEWVKEVGESFQDAWEGLQYLWRTQHNARNHGIVTLVVLLLSWWLRLDPKDLCFILIAIAIVWVAEAFNSVIETLTNMVSPEYTYKAKRIKDMAAAAVLIASLVAALIGLLILAPPLIFRPTHGI